MKVDNIEKLFVNELKDLYSAEKQITHALPKMAKAATTEELRTAFETHLKETEGQVARLEEVAKLLEMKPTGRKCAGMEGCIKEGAGALGQEGNETIVDLGIIGAGSRVEHYEMAGYMTAIALAQRLEATEVVSLLGQSLAEEQGAEQKLRKISGSLMKSAATGSN